MYWWPFCVLRDGDAVEEEFDIWSSLVFGKGTRVRKRSTHRLEFGDNYVELEPVTRVDHA